MVDRRRLGIGIGAPRAHLLQYVVRVTVVVQPGRQPRADVATARNRRKIVEFLQQVVVGQRLDDAERKRRAANAAAGQRQCRQPASIRHSIDLTPPRLLALFDQPALGIADGQQIRWGSCARIERRQFVQQGFRQGVWLGDLVRHGWTPVFSFGLELCSPPIKAQAKSRGSRNRTFGVHLKAWPQFLLKLADGVPFIPRKAPGKRRSRQPRPWIPG